MRQIGRYEIVERIGRGMQGTVYKARDPELDRLVAIKLLHAESADEELSGEADSDTETPLEARISSRLRHPNIVSIYDFGHLLSYQYLVFEYVEGQTLRQLLGSRGNLSIEQVARLAVPIIDAIAYAHGEGVVHLDLSPRNVLVDARQNPRIMDFGLSQFATTYEQQGDEIKGTPIYMAPEYFSGEPLGPYTDIYALAASFYQLVVGEPLVGGRSIAEIAYGIQHNDADFARIPDDERRDDFTAVLRACLEKDYRKRVQNGAQLKQLFARFLSRHPVEALGQGSEVHSTVRFLLRRMQRKEDFPSISRVLNDINRLTEEGNSATADKLANIILRDYALTNKLLKLVNSAMYAGAGSKVASVSKAIVLLGFKKVRSIANSLAYFGRLQGGSDNARLRDAMIRSFLSGLLSRHLVQRAQAGDAEEGFICGLFQNLGENLTAYYFAEDHAEILALAALGGGDKVAASKRVLGVSFVDLGVEVAEIWGLPGSIIESIRGVEPDRAEDGSSPYAHVRDSAVFANRLCAIPELATQAEQDAAFASLISEQGAALGLDETLSVRLYAAAMEKLAANASILEFDPDSSTYCHAARDWLATRSVDANAGQDAPLAASAASAT